MRRFIMRAYAVVAAGMVLGIAGVAGASASGAAHRTAQTGLAGAPHTMASPGTQLWVARYDGGGSGGAQATSIAVSPDGTKVFVTGSNVSVTDAFYDYATVAYQG